MDWSQYGLPGLVIAGLLAYFVLIEKNRREDRERLEKMHSEERAEWKKTIDKQFEDSNKVNRDTTDILSEIKTILRSTKNGNR